MDNEIASASATDIKPILKKRKTKRRADLSIDQLTRISSDATGRAANDSKSGERRRQRWEMLARVKPRVEDRERERRLMGVATRGVVHLFNAIKQHQKSATRQVARAKGERRAELALERATKGSKFLGTLNETKTRLDHHKRPKRKKGELDSLPHMDSINVKQEQDDPNENFDHDDDDNAHRRNKRKEKKSCDDDSAKWKVFRDDFLTSNDTTE